MVLKNGYEKLRKGERPRAKNTAIAITEVHYIITGNDDSRWTTMDHRWAGSLKLYSGTHSGIRPARGGCARRLREGEVAMQGV